MMSLHEYRRLALMSLWTGLIATLGIVFVFVPNVELVILTAFLAGVALGPRQGMVVAMLGEALFSTLNPIGSGLGFPVLFALQIVAVGCSGLVGGLFHRREPRTVHPLVVSLMFACAGFGLTLIYDVLTALSMPLAAGVIEGTLLGTLLGGLAFFITHLVSNTILFAFFGPPLSRLVQEQVLMHELDLR